MDKEILEAFLYLPVYCVSGLHCTKFLEDVQGGSNPSGCVHQWVLPVIPKLGTYQPGHQVERATKETA